MPAFLVQTSVKATIVLLAAWLLARAMARCSAAARHLVWTLAVVAALVLPLLQVAAPRWNVPLLPAPAAATAAPAVIASTVSEPKSALARPVDTAREHQVRLAPATQTSMASVDPRSPSTPAFEISWVAGAVAVWIAGLTFALARLAAGLAWVSRITREATDIDDPLWTTTLNEFAAAFGITTPVSLKISSETTIPVMCGIRTPAVLLPPEAAAWPDERRRVVLLHELAHVARRDCLVQTIAQLARAVHWFNPLAHVAAARLRAEQERASDDLVLAAGTDAPVYADHLFELARTFRTERYQAWATLAMARPSQIERRVMDILDDRRNRRPPARGVRAAVGACAAALILPIGALQLTAAAEPEGPQSAPVMSAGERVAAGRALEAGEATTAARAPVDAQRHDPQPDAMVSAAGQLIDVLPGLDFDVDVDVDFDGPDSDPDPDPDPIPTPNPLPSAPNSAARVRLGGADNAQAQTQSQSQDTVVSDETRRRVADALLTALNDENQEVREQALSALAGMRDPRAIPGLLKALRDPSVGVREQALNALARFDRPEATEGILSALKDQSADVRERAARLVAVLGSRGRVNDPKYVAVVSDLLKDAAPDVRMQAIVALGRMRRQEAVPSLLPMLKDMNTSVREQAAVALGDIADPRAIDALTAALKDSEPEVREQAARALGQIARGQRPANPRAPVPPLPPLPPRPPQVKLDAGAINKAVQQAQETLQLELPKLQRQQQEFKRQQQDFERQQRDIERQAEELQREAERLFR